jgi:hypothetical protein
VYVTYYNHYHHHHHHHNLHQHRFYNSVRVFLASLKIYLHSSVFLSVGLFLASFTTYSLHRAFGLPVFLRSIGCYSHHEVFPQLSRFTGNPYQSLLEYSPSDRRGYSLLLLLLLILLLLQLTLKRDKSSWFKKYRFRLSFGRKLVRISAGTPTILFKVFLGSPLSIQENTGTAL